MTQGLRGIFLQELRIVFRILFVSLYGEDGNSVTFPQAMAKNWPPTWVIDIQGKTPWVDSACADCPGFWGLGCCPPPRLPPPSRSLRLCPWASILLHGSLDILLGSAAQPPHHRMQKTGRTAHVFTAQGGARAETWRPTDPAHNTPDPHGLLVWFS